MKLPIYLDYAATTPVDPRVAEKMQGCLCMDGCFGNPASSSHCYGRDAKERVETAREQVADLINASPEEIVWTSGATESDNLAIIGAGRFNCKKGKHIITCKTEHKAVLDTCDFLTKEGFEITYLQPEKNGIVDLEKFKQAIRDDTVLVSIMHVNNEIGVIQDIEKIGEICHENKIIYHVDAAQSAGKIALDMQQLPVDLLSISGHKMYGPKGVGVLYVRRKPRIRLSAIIHGGGHEHGMRSGTLATHQIVGMGEACRIAKSEMQEEVKRIRKLRDKLWNSIKDIEEIYLNGDLEQRCCAHLNFSVGYVEGGALLMALKDIAVSTGSACTSATTQASYVLRALGISDHLAHSSIRLTVGRFTTDEDIDFTSKHIHEGIDWLRSLSPLWEQRSRA